MLLQCDDYFKNFFYPWNTVYFQMLYKMNPFFFSVLSFYGFTKEEERHMEEVTVENGEFHKMFDAYFKVYLKSVNINVIQTLKSFKC